MGEIRKCISRLFSLVNTNCVITSVNQTHFLRDPPTNIMSCSIRRNRAESFLQKNVEIKISRRRDVTDVDDRFAAVIHESAQDVQPHGREGPVGAAEGWPAQEEDAVLGVGQAVHDVRRSHLNGHGEARLAKNLVEGKDGEGLSLGFREDGFFFGVARALELAGGKQLQGLGEDVLDVAGATAHGDEGGCVREGGLADGGGEGFGGFFGADKAPAEVGGREAVGFEGKRDADHVGEHGAEVVDEGLVGAVVLAAGFAEGSLDDADDVGLVQRRGAARAGHVGEHLADLDDAGGVEHLVVTADVALEDVVRLRFDAFLDVLGELLDGFGSVGFGEKLSAAVACGSSGVEVVDVLAVREHAGDSVEAEPVRVPHLTGSVGLVLVHGFVDLERFGRFGGHGGELLLIDDGIALGELASGASARAGAVGEGGVDANWQRRVRRKGGSCYLGISLTTISLRRWWRRKNGS